MRIYVFPQVRVALGKKKSPAHKVPGFVVRAEPFRLALVAQWPEAAARAVTDVRQAVPVVDIPTCLMSYAPIGSKALPQKPPFPTDRPDHS